jgi:hypothetical protein
MLSIPRFLHCPMSENDDFVFCLHLHSVRVKILGKKHCHRCAEICKENTSKTNICMM